MKENEHSEEQQERGWTPNTPGGKKEALKNEQRSLDIGESGQFAPRAYYNPQAITQPLRRPTFDDIVPPGR